MKIPFKPFNIKVLLLCLGIFTVVTGCGATGGGSKKAVVLNVWGTSDSSDVMRQLFTGFGKSAPGVQIVYTKKDPATYESDLLNALASGTGPDVFAIHNDWLPKYEDKLLPAPASIFDVKTYNDDFLDVANADFIADGKIYAAPMSVDSLALYYNKDILGSAGIATPPATWQELSVDTRAITKMNGFGNFAKSGIAMGTTSNVAYADDILYLLMLQDGTVPYSSDLSSSTLDQSVISASGSTYFPAAEALSFYTSFSNPSSSNYTWNQRSQNSIEAFANGQLAFLYGYSSTRAQIMQKAPNLNFDVAPVPQPNANQNLVNFANYWGYGVSKQSQNSATAWKLVKYLTSKTVLQQYYTLDKLPASRRDMVSDQLEDPEIGVFAESNLTAKSFYKKDQSQVDGIIKNMIDDVTSRGKSINDALTNAVEQINALLR